MTRARIALHWLAAGTLLLAACGGGTRARRDGPAPRDPNLITADEISRISVMNAYDAVKRLRPQFLTPHGAVSLTDPRANIPVVYLDGMRYGDASALAGIDAAGIAAIRYISGPEAQQRFGTNNLAGAILVTTKVRVPPPR
jgi:hypothetical protein